jgi:hypothetical protein
MATGDTLMGSPGQTVYLDRSTSNALQLNDKTSGSLFGTMMKMYVKQTFTFNGFSFRTKTAGIAQGIGYYKQGSYVGHETTPASWTPIDTGNFASSPAGTVHTVNFGNPVVFNAGDTISLYLANSKGTKIMNQGLTGVQIKDVYKSNGQFDLYGATGGAYFGANMVKPSTATSSGLYIEMFFGSNNVCGNNRVPVTLPVNTDTAAASFTHILDPNGADVVFNGSASAGHIFNWYFGDGTTASGMMANHTYSNGTYTAKLVVEDTVCGSIDSMEVIINATVGLSESLLGRTFNVYPNPNNGLFRLAFEMEGVKEVTLNITDELGRLVYSEYLGNVAGMHQQDVDFRNHAQGVYIVHLTANGESVYKKISILF